MAATVTGRRLELALEAPKPRTVLSYDRHGDLVEIPAEPQLAAERLERRGPRSSR